MSEIKNTVNYKNEVLYQGKYIQISDEAIPKADFLRTSTPVSDIEQLRRELLADEKNDSSDNEFIPLDFPRTSTPVPVRKNPVKETKYSINIRYEKWCEKLNQPPAKLRLKGIISGPHGIISGHLIPLENNESEELIISDNFNNPPPIKTTLLPPPPPKDVNHKDKNFHIPKKIKSIFKIPGKSLLQRTCHFLKPKNKDTCISGYPKCTCKLDESVRGNYNIVPSSH